MRRKYVGRNSSATLVRCLSCHLCCLAHLNRSQLHAKVVRNAHTHTLTHRYNTTKTLRSQFAPLTFCSMRLCACVCCACVSESQYRCLSGVRFVVATHSHTNAIRSSTQKKSIDTFTIFINIYILFHLVSYKQLIAYIDGRAAELDFSFFRMENHRIALK